MESMKLRRRDVIVSLHLLLSRCIVGTYKAPLDATPTRWLLLSVSEMDRVADVTPEN
jgi:hypothetical protein